MVFFAVLSVVAIGFVFKFLPETKARSVEQVVQIFERRGRTQQGARLARPSPWKVAPPIRYRRPHPLVRWIRRKRDAGF
jgi:hypothetical protein